MFDSDWMDRRARAGALVAAQLRDAEDERDAAIAERDRLRRELEILREHVGKRAEQHERMFRYEAEAALHDVADCIDTILRGD